MGGMYRADADQAQKPFGVTIAYMGLLFAVLASGCQSSDLPGKERELTSQVYGKFCLLCGILQVLIQCSMLFLSMSSNDQLPVPTHNRRHADAACDWERAIVQHEPRDIVCPPWYDPSNGAGAWLACGVRSFHCSRAISQTPRVVSFLTALQWQLLIMSRWSMAWQDSHFSLSYDRPSTTAVSQPEIAYKEDRKPGELSYFETLCRIISLALEVVRSRMLSPHSQLSYKTIQTYKERIQQIMIEAKPHLRDRKYCLSATEHLERVVLKLHSSYFSSELCRPALKANADISDPALSSMRTDCVTNLMTTVEAYVEMHTVSSHASRSWIALQRAISSIFLLAVTEEVKGHSRFWTLLQQLKMIIAERANIEGDYGAATEAAAVPPVDSGARLGAAPRPPSTAAPSPAGMNSASPASAAVAVDTQTQWAKPLTKTLRALEKLEGAFNAQAARASQAGSPNYLNPGMGVPPVSASMTPSLGSLPPPTPESSTSGEWTIPNILDRAQEYIHPPLWS